MSVLWTLCQSRKNSSKMNRLFLSLFVVVVCSLAASSATCVLDGKKADSENVQVIRLDDPEDQDSSEGGIIEIHIPSGSRRRREIGTKGPEKTCKKDGECAPGKCDKKTSTCRSSKDNNKPAGKSPGIKSSTQPAKPIEEPLGEKSGVPVENHSTKPKTHQGK